MSDIDTNERARQFYALEAHTFDEDYFLQIHCGENVLVTVSASPSPDSPDEFVVYNGIGLDDNDEEDLNAVAKRFVVDINPMDAWREAVRFSYLHALSKMMLPDQRSDREIFGEYI
jgi:hypothetical protein